MALTNLITCKIDKVIHDISMLQDLSHSSCITLPYNHEDQAKVNKRLCHLLKLLVTSVAFRFRILNSLVSLFNVTC